MSEHGPSYSDHRGVPQCERCRDAWPCREQLTARAEAAEQQAARLRAAISGLLSAFVLHRTATHKTRPEHCETCQQGQAAIEQARAALAASQPAPAVEAHEYEGACRNVQHAATGACACIALVNGRRCRLSRINPIHQPDDPRGGQAEGEG